MASTPTGSAAWPSTRLVHPWRGFARPLLAMWRAGQTRRELARLDARLLQDIGVSAPDAARESARPPWDLR